ncbi:MAG: ARMT1-like domain-containing protein [Candidatus Bathyarchaeia archaeon]
MKAGIGCVPCTVRAALDMAEKASKDEREVLIILRKTLRFLSAVDYFEKTPAELHTIVSRIVKEVTGNPDPFKSIKQECNKRALKLIASLTKMMEGLDSLERLNLMIKASVYGNAMDFEVEGYDFKLEEFELNLAKCVERNPIINDVGKLLILLKNSGKIMYLLDNAGEIVFDKLLIQEISQLFKCKIVAVVKQSPVLNDATIEDANMVGLTDVCEVISTGDDHIGVHLDTSSLAFKESVEMSNLLIAKGQGNFETLTEYRSMIKKPICHLFKVKCKVVSDYMKVPVNSDVVSVWKPSVH